jgi:hypothetical protein
MWLYMTGAAAFGGWRGQDLWSDWVIWCFLLPPLAWGVFKIIWEWRRNPYWLTIKVGLLMTGMLVVVMGGLGLGFAAIAANATVKWSASPTVRVIESIAMVAVCVALTWATKGFRGPAEPEEASGSESTKAPAKSEPTHERGDS